MKERKIRSRLLAYYLRQADLGNQEALKKAQLLGDEIFSEDQLVVCYENKAVKTFSSLSVLLKELEMDHEDLFYYLETGEKDRLNRRFYRKSTKE